MPDIEQKLPAGSIRIDKIELKSDLSGEVWDLRSIVQEFSIYENIMAPFLTAEMYVVDGLALTSITPITGHETVNIKFKTPHNSILKEINVTLRIMSIENLSRGKTRSAKYIVHLASEEYMADVTTSVMKSYRQMTVSDMVKAIHEDYLRSEKELDLSTTDGPRTIVIPNMSPTKAIKFLIRESRSLRYPASNFVYFETCDGFQFVTIDELISKRRTVHDPYFSTPKDWQKTNESPRDQAGGGGGSARQSTKPFELLKIDYFEFVSLFNNDKTAKKGGWENTYYYIDPVYSEFGKVEYDYFSKFNQLNRTGQKSGKFISRDSKWVDSKQSMQNFYMTNKSGSNVDTDQKPEYYHLQRGSFGLLSNIVVNVTIPGDSERRAGDVIELRFPEFGATDDIEGKLNKFVSGKYLVIAVRHMYNTQGYVCAMQCIKNSYEEDMVQGLPAETDDPQEVEADMKETLENNIDTGDATPVEPVFPSNVKRSV